MREIAAVAKRSYLCALILVSCLAVAATIGCGGPSKSSVSGKVTRKDGSPLAGARIILRSEEMKKSAHGVTDEQGLYVLGTAEKGDGIYPGKYAVMVVEDLATDDVDTAKPSTIAAKYKRADSSGLSLEVKAGEEQVFDLVLDPK